MKTFRDHPNYGAFKGVRGQLDPENRKKEHSDVCTRWQDNYVDDHDWSSLVLGRLEVSDLSKIMLMMVTPVM